jgi:hypothetical protein
VTIASPLSSHNTWRIRSGSLVSVISIAGDW